MMKTLSRPLSGWAFSTKHNSSLALSIWLAANCLCCLPAWAVSGRVVAWGGGQGNLPDGLTNVAAISSSVDHSLALNADGSVTAWGYDFDGEGNVPSNLGKVTGIAAGEYFSLALKSGGTVAAWGANDYGQCDVPDGLSSVVAISAGHAHCLALRANGTVVAWGSDIYGQADVPAGLSTVKALVAAWNYSLALKANGTVVAWGVDDAGQTDVPAGLDHVVAIAGNETYALAVKSDGTVVAWGASPPLPAGLNNVSAVAAGENHALALKRDGTVVAWGDNSSGETAVPAGVTGVAEVGAAWHYSVALANARAGAVPGQFLARGTYNGLFYPQAAITQSNSGAFTITTTARRTFSGVLQIGSARYPLRGTFDTNGSAEVSIRRHNLNPLAVSFQLDLATPADVVEGSVSDGVWTAILFGNRTIFDPRTNHAPQAGRYTLVIPGNPTSETIPGGDSYGTLTVDNAGRIHFTCSLADNTRFSQSSALSAAGQWPLYISLYGGQGSILSWVTFTNAAGTDLDGDLNWIKPASPRSKYYPAGFMLRTNAFGSSYHPPARGAQVLNFTNAATVFSGGNLTAGFTNHLSFSAGNRVINSSSNKLTMTFSPTTGSFRGVVVNPGNAKSMPFSGVVLQKPNVARGFFLGTNQAGEVRIGP
jgi:Regulator of chromosome condensation (RCC1) repeat